MLMCVLLSVCDCYIVNIPFAICNNNNNIVYSSQFNSCSQY